MNKVVKTLVSLIIVLVAIFSITSLADAYVSVKGYYRSDGTYVRPHVRSNPNGLKYDNYSYTPSQGLYNDSYGTRGSYWDTPTYTTDPDYYVGESLYDSGLSDYSYGSSYNSYYDSTPSCPIFSTYNTLSDSCECMSGYVADGSTCVNASSVCYDKYGYNSRYNSLDNSCECRYGYVFGDNDQCITRDSSCVQDHGYGAEYDILKDSCTCSVGYKVANNRCVLKTTTSSNYSYQTCSDSYGYHTYETSSGKCACMDGYEWSTDKTKCVAKPSYTYQPTANSATVSNSGGTTPSSAEQISSLLELIEQLQAQLAAISQ